MKLKLSAALAAAMVAALLDAAIAASVGFDNYVSPTNNDLVNIAQQVEQYLSQPHGVHGQCAEVLLGVNDEAVLFCSASCPAVLTTSLISGASCTVCGLSSSFPASIFDLPAPARDCHSFVS